MQSIHVCVHHTMLNRIDTTFGFGKHIVIFSLLKFSNKHISTQFYPTYLSILAQVMGYNVAREQYISF